VALGMLAACDISRRMDLVDEGAAGRIERLIGRAGLPLRIKNIPLAGIIKAHYRDKKFIGAKNRLVLITGIGKTKIVENVPKALISSAVKAFSY
jgi:3-dehydroquinate synthetase